MSVCYIIGAGEVGKIDISKNSGDFIIAADGGYRKFASLGISPDLILGDFDSLGFVPDLPTVKKFPSKKDETDTHLAVLEGLSRGYNEFVIYGGLGGRYDHTFANLQTLTYLAGRGARGYLIGTGEVMTVIKNSSLSLPKRNGGYISVFSLSESAKKVRISGLKYEYSGELEFENPLGVSNEFIGKSASVSVENGTLLVVWGK
jgi:thiamine pyrophosphokinase